MQLCVLRCAVGCVLLPRCPINFFHWHVKDMAVKFVRERIIAHETFVAHTELHTKRGGGGGGGGGDGHAIGGGGVIGNTSESRSWTA